LRKRRFCGRSKKENHGGGMGKKKKRRDPDDPKPLNFDNAEKTGPSVKETACRGYVTSQIFPKFSSLGGNKWRLSTAPHNTEKSPNLLNSLLLSFVDSCGLRD